ncbi:MAG TPA: hypothetical protein VEC02_06200 [Nitrososphaerales archaeon]|nr:hypothetical protein [Nitrososphaerales archaeon]
MSTCQSCGRDNPQADATYCSYCGSSLRQQGTAGSPSPYRAQPAAGGGTIGGGSASTLSQRHSRALRRVETAGFVVLVLSIVVMILVLLL